MNTIMIPLRYAWLLPSKIKIAHQSLRYWSSRPFKANGIWKSPVLRELWIFQIARSKIYLPNRNFYNGKIGQNERLEKNHNFLLLNFCKKHVPFERADKIKKNWLNDYLNKLKYFLPIFLSYTPRIYNGIPIGQVDFWPRDLKNSQLP